MIDPVAAPRHVNAARLEAIPVKGDPVFYFQGCTERVYPGINNAFIEICKKLGTPVIASNKQSCCTGNFIPFNTAPVDTVVAITQRNYNIIKAQARSAVTTCNGCFSSFHQCDAIARGNPGVEDRARVVLEGLGHAIVQDVGVFHVAEFLYKNREHVTLASTRRMDGCKVAVHYGCHFLHQEDPAVVLDDPEDPSIIEGTLEGLGVHVARYTERLACCGAGLNQRLIHDDRINALQVTLRKMRSIKAHDVDCIVVVCPYCQLHLDNAQVELEVEFDEEFNIPVVHLAQFIGLAMDVPLEVLRFDVHKVPVDPLLAALGQPR